MIQQRNIALYIILSIVTCGIFTYYWLYVMNEDMNQLTEDYSTSGALLIVLSIITCNIYLWYWLYKMGEKLDLLRQSRGIPSSNTGILYIILAVIGLSIVSYALIQNELNKFSAPPTPPPTYHNY